MTPLAKCKDCGSGVEPKTSNVLRSIPSQRGVMIFFQCPKCGTADSIFLGPEEARKRADEVRRMANAELHAQWLGREVKGFEIDLEIVDTVEDLEFFWDDQERFEPWSIKREEG